MSRSGQLRVSRTKTIPVPNAYIQALQGEFSPWSYDEERAPQFRGQWREGAFQRENDVPLDLEIGTGNGLHFAHHSQRFPNRCVLGIELRYKPLIQTIRRALRNSATNARVARYNAYLLPELFVPGELDDVFIFFPDPWEKSRNHKHRLIQDEFLKHLHVMQKPGSRLHFKTDSADYFAWSRQRFERSPYQLVEVCDDLHRSPALASGNFITQFEQIFIRQGTAIGYAQLVKA